MVEMGAGKKEGLSGKKEVQERKQTECERKVERQRVNGALFTLAVGPEIVIALCLCWPVHGSGLTMVWVHVCACRVARFHSIWAFTLVYRYIHYCSKVWGSLKHLIPPVIRYT